MDKRTFLKTVLGTAVSTVVTIPVLKGPVPTSPLSPWNFPMISRVTEEMITADLIAVQPMTPVDGALFSIKMSYGRTPLQKPRYRTSRMGDLLEYATRVNTIRATL